MLMIFLFAFTYQIFPARATPDIPASESRIHWIFTVPHGITINYNCNDWIWFMGIFGKKLHGRNYARRFHCWQKKQLELNKKNYHTLML